MLVYLVTISLLNLLASSSVGNECGCNVNRDKKSTYAENIITNSIEQCPMEDENPLQRNVNENVATDDMILVPAGEFQFGTDDVVIESDHEGPKRMVKLKSYYLDRYEVSNKDFSAFVKSSKYKTEAEKFGDSFVFTLFLNNTFKEQLKDYRVAQAVWWYKVSGADWSHPDGPDTDIKELLEHPVTHVSWRDAQAFCKWRGGRLPTEAEWEAACRGGHKDTKYPWGDKLFPGRKHMANIWQGTFPTHNSAKDGYVGTGPVHNYSPNDFGFYNMAGNVWEWTEDSWTKTNSAEKVKKGGSYLCHQSYCYRYRCSARSHNTEDSSAGNLGFRCAKSV